MAERNEQRIEDFEVTYKQVVAWGDMDAFRHVNNAVYFRYFENARIVYGEKIAITARMETEGIGPILAWTDCRYIRPVTFPDTLTICTRVLSIQDSEMMMGYWVFSRKLETLAARGRSLGVLYDYRNLKRVNVPDDMISLIESIEGRALPRKHLDPPSGNSDA